MRTTGLGCRFAACVAGLSACAAAAHVLQGAGDNVARQPTQSTPTGDPSGSPVAEQTPPPRQRVAEGDFQELLRTEAFWRKLRSSQPQPAQPPPNQPGAYQFSPPRLGSGGRRATASKKGSGGTYRTICVRLCDGYNWPVSFATTSVERDAKLCERSCESPARLYKAERQDSELADMKDESSQYYRDLKTAFLYQSVYDEACKCKPHPWEQEALDRHARYAAEARVAKRR
jgi:hypothetical protein